MSLLQNAVSAASHGTSEPVPSRELSVIVTSLRSRRKTFSGWLLSLSARWTAQPPDPPVTKLWGGDWGFMKMAGARFNIWEHP